MKQQHGFTFMGLMVVIAVSGILLAAVGTVWRHDVQREKEEDLLYYGDVYRRAITHYYETTPSGTKQFPRSLNDLLIDKRFPNPGHHIRALYPNPMSADGRWQLLREAGRIKGVAAESNDIPIKVAGFPEIYRDFAKAQSYSDWQFVYIEEQENPNANGKKGAGGSNFGASKSSTNNSSGSKPSGNPFK